MAVRNDFAPGEVLAAADLNDSLNAKANLASPTFTGTPAAPTAASGTNTTQLATTAFVQGAGGLVHINTTSFSAVSSVSLNNVFSSTYTNYKIVIDQLSASTFSSLLWRLRVGGADNTVAVYTILGLVTTENFQGLFRILAQTSFNIGDINTGFNYGMSIELQAPQLAQNTNATVNTTGRNSLVATSVTAGLIHYASTAFDGLTLFPSSGTITGTIRVYGYKNS
jgi:hypothetical protein